MLQGKEISVCVKMHWQTRGQTQWSVSYPFPNEINERFV